MSQKQISNQILSLVLWIVVTFVAAGIGAVGSAQAGTFYGELRLPSWAPPASLFGPVWTVLYILMAVAVWLVWRADPAHPKRTAITIYVIQLALNALWSWLFFRWQLGAVAFIDIVILFCLIIATIIAFWRIYPLAGALMIPYLLWVGFASVLNFVIWQLNPVVL